MEVHGTLAQATPPIGAFASDTRRSNYYSYRQKTLPKGALLQIPPLGSRQVCLPNSDAVCEDLAGHTAVAHFVGLCYVYGYSFAKDTTKGINWLQQAIDLGLAVTMPTTR